MRSLYARKLYFYSQLAIEARHAARRLQHKLQNTTIAGNWPLAKQLKICFVAVSQEKITLYENYTHTFRSSYYFLFLRENPFDFVILPFLAQNGSKCETREICPVKWPQRCE